MDSSMRARVGKSRVDGLSVDWDNVLLYKEVGILLVRKRIYGSNLRQTTPEKKARAWDYRS